MTTRTIATCIVGLLTVLVLAATADGGTLTVANDGVDGPRRPGCGPRFAARHDRDGRARGAIQQRRVGHAIEVSALASRRREQRAALVEPPGRDYGDELIEGGEVSRRIGAEDGEIGRGALLDPTQTWQWKTRRGVDRRGGQRALRAETRLREQANLFVE